MRIVHAVAEHAWLSLFLSRRGIRESTRHVNAKGYGCSKDRHKHTRMVTHRGNCRFEGVSFIRLSQFVPHAVMGEKEAFAPKEAVTERMLWKAV